MKRKRMTEWMDCVTCGKKVGPGEGIVVYPLPAHMRRMLSPMTQAWTTGIRHKTCPLPPEEEEGHWNDPDGDPSDD